MSDFDVLKFIVNVMEHVYRNTIDMTEDVNVFVYTLWSIVHSFVASIKILTLL